MNVPLLLAIVGITTLFARTGSGEQEISARLIPDEIRPGDIFRMEVSRTGDDFKEFQLEVPLHEHLHLLAREISPVTLNNGLYIQKEAWIFQADTSGEISLEGTLVKLVSGGTEEILPLPNLKLSVLPYKEMDTDPTPLALGNLIDEDSKGYFSIYLFITGLLTVVAIVYLITRKSKFKSVTETSGPSISDTAIADLDQGYLSPDSLYLLYEDMGHTLSQQLRSQIENAIYANRGDPKQLAAALRKEIRS